MPTHLKNGFNKYAQPKKYASGYQEEQSEFAVKSLNHEPQASITWRVRLESAFNKMLVRKGESVSGLGEKMS